MRVVHIGTAVSESSANVRLHRALLTQGIDSAILTLSHNGDIQEVYDLQLSFWDKLAVLAKIKIKELKREQEHIRSDIPFSFGDIGYQLKKNKQIQDADIIHLHWICNILSIESIRELIKLHKPIVWTCHDSWAFTGGCHVRYGCDGYQSGCTDCKVLVNKESNDLAKKILFEKKRKWLYNEMVFIAPSNWMKENILASSLFCNNNVAVIPNALDIAIYKRVESKKSSNKMSILFGATNAQTPYKGFEYLVKMLEELTDMIPNVEQKYCLQFVGTNKIENAIIEKFECTFWGFVTEQKEMARIYSLADVFVCPSLDDNLPSMVMESMACETPVVAFTTGGIPDMIEHKQNGYLAEYKNAKDLAKGMIWILNNNQEGKIGVEARNKVLNNYAQEIVAEKHIGLYESLLKRPH